MPSKPLPGPLPANVLQAFEPGALAALAQVLLIDIVLAGDNAVAVGLVAASLPAHQRRKAILVGIALAAVLRVLFALVAVQLLQLFGLLLAGGLLLLWVAWKLARELRRPAPEPAQGEAAAHPEGKPPPAKTMRQAMVQIVIADASMSLDNVLAVAAAARDHPVVLFIGLALAVALMGFAASIIARLLDKHGWIAWVGVAIIAWVACLMVYEGGMEVVRFVRA